MMSDQINLKNYRAEFVGKLSSIYDEMEAESFFYMILEEKHQLKRIDLALNPEMTVSEFAISQWNEILEKLQREIPIQYILGKSHFFGLEFFVDENVLIPRPETEELVDWILSNHKNLKPSNLKILDIGTGSGCIAISLAKNIPHANVSAIDVSEKALNLAKHNAESNLVQVNFIQQDILKTTILSEKFDIIVSNPPYIRNLEKQEIKNNVLENEPHLALFVHDEDALIFYHKIASLAMENLSENGELYFEINQYLAKETMDLLEMQGFGFMELRKDIYGNDRMILARL